VIALEVKRMGIILRFLKGDYLALALTAVALMVTVAMLLMNSYTETYP
jgi:uncharacterized membrane protein YraQ (UPF0718 family)